jgi:hypothetical protein
MVAIFGTSLRNTLVRGAVMAAVVVPMSLLAACSQPAPAPQPAVYQAPPPPPPAPMPTGVPPARG